MKQTSACRVHRGAYGRMLISLRVRQLARTALRGYKSRCGRIPPAARRQLKARMWCNRLTKFFNRQDTFRQPAKMFLPTDGDPRNNQKTKGTGKWAK